MGVRQHSGEAKRAAVDVLTGRARHIVSREVHRLRSGTGGDDPVRRRPEDDATGMRCAVEINVPSARRLHWWLLTDGRIELAKVVAHDDFSI